MSIASQLPSSSLPASNQSVWSPARRWFVAALTPVLLAPIWLSLVPILSGTATTISAMLLTLLLVTATVTDVRFRKIYNWTTYTVFLWAVAIQFWPLWGNLPVSEIRWADSLIGAGVCFLVMLVPYSMARGGAGDVKLAAAIGALIGLDAGLLVIAFTYIIAAVGILAWNTWNAGPLQLTAALFRKLLARWFPQYVRRPSETELKLLQQPIPLAGFFLLATMAVTWDLPVWLRGL